MNSALIPWKRLNLEEHRAGRLCQVCLENPDPESLDRAGRAPTGSRDGYTYLGRS